MSDPLATYLHDHLAAANFAVELLKNLHEQHSGDALGSFAGALQMEVEQDRAVLERIIERLGAEPAVLKDAAAWVGEKVSRLKLSREVSGEAGTFQALETLALGILGKRALWETLRVIAPRDWRLSGQPFDELAARAEAQHARVEEWRLQWALKALTASAE